MNGMEYIPYTAPPPENKEEKKKEAPKVVVNGI
jgi:hypothetical protein